MKSVLPSGLKMLEELSKNLWWVWNSEGKKLFHDLDADLWRATGENPVVLSMREADVVIGPIGIILADSMLGEITPRMAEAVGASRARKILIPINRCVTVAGVDEALTLSEYIKLAVDKI